MKRIIKEQVKAQTSKIMTKVKKYVIDTLGAEVLIRSTNQPQTSYASLFQKDMMMKTRMKNPSLDQTEGQREGGQARKLRDDDVSPVREVSNVDERLWNPTGSRTPDREWNKTKTIDDRPSQPWMSQLAQALGTTSSFNEFLATPIDFSAFIMNRLNIQNITQDLLSSPTYDLIKGTCKSVVELEYHLEEVFKATNDQLDWHNPKGRPYPHDLSKPLPLIPDARDKIPRSTWSEIQDVYDKHAYWGTYHWGPKHQRFYGYTTNLETSKDFREGDFKRLRRKDIKDMLLLLVQEKLTNLNVDERFALNVALRMYTRRIVIQERVEDLKLAVESYQKKINLTKPDTYRSDISKKTPYTAYRDIQGIIYQDDMNKSVLKCITR
ncbi:hypothetical protein Tco_1264516 [Tanacetum coccineum]